MQNRSIRQSDGSPGRSERPPPSYSLSLLALPAQLLHVEPALRPTAAELLRDPVAAAHGPARSGGARPARDGFLIAFLNPKVALFFLALFSQFIDAGMGTVARVQVAATAVVIDGGWYSLVALMLARGPVLAALRRHQDRVERATAGVLAVIAVIVWV